MDIDWFPASYSFILGQEYSSTQPTAPTGPPPPYADHCDAAAAQGQAARLPQYQPPGHVTGINATVLRATPQLTSPAYNDIDRSDGSHFVSTAELVKIYKYNMNACIIVCSER